MELSRARGHYLYEDGLRRARNTPGELVGRDRFEHSSELDLWAAAVRGQAEAFGELFERHSDKIYNYAFRRTGDWAAAEEVTSVAFLEAWRCRGSPEFHGDDAVLPWLLGIATNVIRRRWRTRRRHRRALDRMPLSDPQLGPDNDVPGRIDDERRMRRILALVSQLSRKHQDVLVLVVWEGLSYEEAALALDIPVGTVRSRLSRAREGLRALEMEVVPGGGRAKSNVIALHERKDSA